MELNDLRHEAAAPGVTLDEDTFERLPDGRNVLVGRKGQTIPIALAQRLGLAQAGPDVRGADLKALREAQIAADKAVPTPTLDRLGQSPGSPEPAAEPAPEIFTRPSKEEAPQAGVVTRPSGRRAQPKPAEGEGK